MTLTKKDLKNVGLTFEQKFDELGVVTKNDIKNVATKKDVQKIDKKFDKLFNFLDRDLSKTKRQVREIQEHFRMPTSEF